MVIGWGILFVLVVMGGDFFLGQLWVGNLNKEVLADYMLVSWAV